MQELADMSGKFNAHADEVALYLLPTSISSIAIILRRPLFMQLAFAHYETPVIRKAKLQDKLCRAPLASQPDVGRRVISPEGDLQSAITTGLYALQ